MKIMYIGVDNMFQSQDERMTDYNDIMTHGIGMVLYLEKNNVSEEYAPVNKGDICNDIFDGMVSKYNP